jgi:hypothetical protein
LRYIVEFLHTYAIKNKIEFSNGAWKLEKESKRLPAQTDLYNCGTSIFMYVDILLLKKRKIELCDSDPEQCTVSETTFEICFENGGFINNFVILPILLKILKVKISNIGMPKIELFNSVSHLNI